MTCPKMKKYMQTWFGIRSNFTIWYVPSEFERSDVFIATFATAGVAADQSKRSLYRYK